MTILFLPSLQLNNVYSKADRLNKWYKNVRIDSFSQGSVLVDYFVELTDVSRDINTLEIKQMFHNALTTVPITVVPLGDSGNQTVALERNINADDQDEKFKVKQSHLLGKFVLDPVSTDFIGKSLHIFALCTIF